MPKMIVLLIIMSASVAAVAAATLVDVLEPNLPTGLSASTQINTSQAISLKRIADALDRIASKTDSPVTCNPVMQCSPQVPKVP